MKRLMTPVALLWSLGVPIAAQDSVPPAAAEQALMESAYLGKLVEVQRLVSAGAVVDAADQEHRTSLMWAAFNGHTAVVEYLLEKGAKLGAKDASGRTALMYASSGPFAETVELLLKEGAEVNVQGKLEGFTALMTAASEGQLEVVRLLLAHGADPSLVDKDGDTAASFARQKGHSAVVDLLENPPAPSQ
jgi:ankyrin repeat protein